MTTFGVDYAWGRPGPAALKAAGAHFACRYLSHDTTGKNLTRAEADQLSKARIALVVVWESGAQRALSGHAAGAADARAALSQAQACGMPAGRPIYFAVDFDATAGQQATINAYLDGAASVLGRARVGLYAGYYVIKRAFDAHKITWGWQTYAWSGGHWDSRAQLQQYSNNHKIGGVGLDYDRAMTSDYGQWRVGVTPAKEDDVELTDRVKLTGADGERLWAGQYMNNDSVSVNYALGVAAMAPFYMLKTLVPRLEALQATNAELVKALAALADNGGSVDVDALVKRIEDKIDAIEIHLDVPDAEPADAG